MVFFSLHRPFEASFIKLLLAGVNVIEKAKASQRVVAKTRTPENKDLRPENEDPSLSLSILKKDVIKRELSANKNSVHLLDSS